MTAAFDTLKLADKLETAGFSNQQARGAASALSDAFTADIATRNDITILRSDLDKTRLQLEAKIADAKAETLRWIVGAIGLQTVAFILMKVLRH